MSDLRTLEQRQLQDARQRERDAEERSLARAYFLTFGSESGKRVLKDIERRGFLYRTTLSAPDERRPLDPMQTVAHEGKRQLVIEIKHQIELGAVSDDGGQSPAKAVTTIAT